MLRGLIDKIVGNVVKLRHPKETMASTVEQCESKLPINLNPLASTMEMFDTFKCSQDEDKDSDEESFHLPLLGCDDDVETGKEISPNETEDEILNKFETSETPELDPKLEEKILNEDETIDSKNTNGTDSKDSTCLDSVENAEENFNEKGCDDAMFFDLEVIDEADGCSDESKNNTKEEDQTATAVENMEIEDQFEENKTIQNDEQISEVDDATPDVVENGEDTNTISNEKDIEDNTLVSENNEVESDTMSSQKVEVSQNDNEKIIEDSLQKSTEAEQNEILDNNVDNTEESTTENSTESDTLKESQDHDDNKTETEISSHDCEIVNEVEDPSNIELEKEPEVIDDLNKDISEEETKEPVEAMEDEEPIKEPVEAMENEEATKEPVESMEDEEPTKDSTLTAENEETLAPSIETEKEELLTSVEENKESVQSVDDNKDEITESSEDKTEEETAMDIDEEKVDDNGDITEKPEEKLDNLETSSKPEEMEKNEETNQENSLECEDLLDISVIRDADEDNATAEENENAENETPSDKSDTDEQEEEKQENETEDVEMEHEEPQISTEPTEENIEDNQDSCDQDNSTTDNLVSDSTSDSENKENEPVQDETSNRTLSIDDVTEIDSNESTVEQEKPQEVSEKLLEKEDSVKPEDLPTNQPSQEVPSKPIEEPTERFKETANKRPLSESDNEVAVSKKIRLDEKGTKIKKLDDKKKDKMKSLLTFQQYMKKRNLGEGKLTRSDLEQFALQKISEAIMHTTDVGELHQTIKKQENVIETLRKDYQQLSKQARDLDIVNKKLMNELRNQNGTQKPLVPLKITRSVGLQVKLSIGTEPVVRRKSYTTTSPRTPVTTPTTTTTPVNRPRPQGNVVRQVTAQAPTAATPPARSPQKATPPTSILTQALQTRPTPQVAQTVTPNNKRPTPTRPKAAEPAKPSAPGVIDLTDEDDRTAKSAHNIIQKKTMNTPVKILNKNINIVQNKTVNISPKTAVKPGMQPKVGMQARALTGLPQGVRLTAAQMKNGITLPAGVVTTNAQGGTQLMYVVPSSLANSTAGGPQKAVLLNFQPTNGVLTSTINGSTVSVIPSKNGSMQLKTITTPRKHPAPLPLPPPAVINNSLKKLLPKPHLSIRKTDTGIILQWRMPYNLDDFESIASYQLFAYQETSAPPSTDMWRKVGDVKALALPMACTLTQFADKNKYYFAVRSVDIHKRIGAFSDPEEISL